MNRDDESPTAALEPHAKRRVRAFIRRMEREPDHAAHRAFWDVLFASHPNITHEIAVRVAVELMRTDKTVQDLIDGWRPVALRLN